MKKLLYSLMLCLCLSSMATEPLVNHGDYQNNLAVQLASEMIYKGLPRSIVTISTKTDESIYIYRRRLLLFESINGEQFLYTKHGSLLIEEEYLNHGKIDYKAVSDRLFTGETLESVEVVECEKSQTRMDVEAPYLLSPNEDTKKRVCRTPNICAIQAVNYQAQLAEAGNKNHSMLLLVSYTSGGKDMAHAYCLFLSDDFRLFAYDYAGKHPIKAPIYGVLEVAKQLKPFVTSAKFIK